MIASFIVILASIAAPDLYFFDAKNDLMGASTEAGKGECRIRIRKLSQDTEASARSMTFDMFLSLSCRLSRVNQTLWILEAQKKMYSGTNNHPDVVIGRCLVDGIKGPETRLPKIIPEERLGDVITSSTGFEKLIDRMLLQGDGRMLSQRNSQNANEPCDIWPCPLYSDLTRPIRGDGSPYIVIAAMNAHVAVVGIYSKGKMLFVECRARMPSETEPARTDSPENLQLVGAGKDGLRWSSLGVVDTEIRSWATGFWTDDSLHLIADDGLHECFKIVNGNVARQDGYAPLPAPSGFCQFPSGLWIFSRYTANTIATKVPLKADQALENRDLGYISLDAAARELSKSE